MVKLDLCEACATKLEVTDVNAVAVEDLIKKIRQLEEEREAGASSKCPQCGFSLNKFHQSGRLGCPDCYDIFEEELRETLNGCQKSVLHSGKIPEQEKSIIASRRLEKLKEELQAAIRDEKYETAAKLRDCIEEANPN